ncbi:MAG: ArsA family ATPase [Acidobacteria bacterium]|nr:ArsA family ATPase [Acidobacteriota bacterium]
MQILVFLGTGGVGKTSAAAAAALHAAIRGDRCLVLAIDPARRLRTALELRSGAAQEKVALDAFSARGELWAGLLDVRATLDQAVRLYAKPRQAEAVVKHPIYQALISSLAGMEELVAIERLDQAIREGFETIVIDTAPSRHALEFLDKPDFFVQLVSFPVVQLVGRLYKWWERSPMAALSRKSLELYSRVETLLGAALVRQILDFYSVFFTVAEGYADRARQTTAKLRDPATTGFFIVTTPLKARRDGEYFWQELHRRKFPVRGLMVNRVWPAAARELPENAPALARDALDWYRRVSAAHHQAWESARDEFGGRMTRMVKIPELARDVDGLPALMEIARHLEPAITIESRK